MNNSVIAYTVTEFPKTFDATVRFVKDDQGEVTHMVFLTGGGEIRAE